MNPCLLGGRELYKKIHLEFRILPLYIRYIRLSAPLNYIAQYTLYIMLLLFVYKMVGIYFIVKLSQMLVFMTVMKCNVSKHVEKRTISVFITFVFSHGISDLFTLHIPAITTSYFF